MVWWEDDDERRKIRSGYVSEDEEKFFRKLMRLPRARLSRRNKIQSDAIRWRNWTVENEWGRTNGQQVVVKVVGNTKSQASASAMIRYVARRREQDRREGRYGSVGLYDQFGREAEYPRSLAQNWGLPADHENLSKAARDLEAKRKKLEASEMPVGERLHNIQVWHLIVSLLVEEGEEELQISEALERAARKVISEAFAKEGHKVFWGMHLDCPGRPHAHIFIKAKSEWGNRLHFDKHGDRLHVLRQEFQGALRDGGVAREATRREDRYDTRDRILRGIEPLRTGLKINDYKRPLRPRVRFKKQNRETLHQSVWAGISGKWRKEKIVGDATPPFFKELYEDPMSAYALWYHLVFQEAVQKRIGHLDLPHGAYGVWLAAKHPQTFGAIKDDAPKARNPAELRTLFEKMALPAPDPRFDIEVNLGSLPLRKKRSISDVRQNRLSVIASLVRVMRLWAANMDDRQWLDRRSRSLLNDLDCHIVSQPTYTRIDQVRRVAKKQEVHSPSRPLQYPAKIVAPVVVQSQHRDANFTEDNELGGKKKGAQQSQVNQSFEKEKQSKPGRGY